MTKQEITEDYPELQNIHIKAALAFAAERNAVTSVFVHETVLLDTNLSWRLMQG